MHKKSINKRIFILLAGFMIICSCNSIRKEIQPVDMHYEKTANVADSGKRYQGNSFLYIKKNGLLTFPHIFGKSLYLYSIDEKKEYLIDRTHVPWRSLDSEMLLNNDNVFYGETEPINGDVTTEKRINLQNRKVYKHEYEKGFEFCFYKNSIISIDRKHNVCAVDLKSGEKKILLKDPGYESEEMFLISDTVYIYDQRYDSLKCEISGVNVETGEVLKINDDYYGIGAMTGIDDKRVLIEMYHVNKWKLIEYNLENDTVRNIFFDDDMQSDKHGLNCKNMEFKDKKVYLVDLDGDILRIDYITGEKENIINASDYIQTYWAYDYYVSFCDDYIVVDARYSHKGPGSIIFEKHDVFIFDYAGNLIRQIY